MNKTSIFQKPWLLSVGLMVPTLMTLASMPANALDLKGFSTSNDAACAIDPICASSRGGVSDVMTIFDANGNIFDQIFAFGNEEANNLYYFDPAKVTVDPSQLENYTTLLEPDKSWSDTFGLARANGALVLGFISDPQEQFPSTGPIVYLEEPGGPLPYIPETGSVFTIPYNATFYLDPKLGLTAEFRSDYEVPEPLTMLGAGAALGFGSFFKRKLGKNNKQDKA